jgi:hypothetical protein
MLEIKLTSCMKENEIRELCLLEKRVYSCTNCMINPPPLEGISADVIWGKKYEK